jgi:uncharacterized protein YecT (DUF1311 family)
MRNTLKAQTYNFILTTLIATLGLTYILPVKAQNLIKDSGENQSGQILISQINCEDPKNVADANTCLAEVDKELNQTYQQIIRGLSGGDRKKLITAEQAWIKYRDTNCAFRIRDFPLSTSMGRQFYFSCQARMTRERTEELKR